MLVMILIGRVGQSMSDCSHDIIDETHQKEKIELHGYKQEMSGEII